MLKTMPVGSVLIVVLLVVVAIAVRLGLMPVKSTRIATCRRGSRDGDVRIASVVIARSGGQGKVC